MALFLAHAVYVSMATVWLCVALSSPLRRGLVCEEAELVYSRLLGKRDTLTMLAAFLTCLAVPVALIELASHA